MHAYFQTKRPTDLTALLAATDKFFHEEGRWGESPLAALAASCLENELFAQSAAYYEELIPLHQNTQPGRGIGNGTLSGYYTNEALAYSGLKQTAKAVEAASGAIVSWGPRHQQRAEALKTLQRVLAASPDLAAYIAELDKETAESHQENPIVRKALGQVLLSQGQFAQAITQLQLAVAAQPNDAETHQALIECYDKQQDKAGALQQVFASLDLNRRDIALYKNLGERLAALAQPQEAERAYTSIVEVLPGETESHTLLAEVRQSQNRWKDAIGHWEQVARLRSLEPTGLVKLAQAQLHEKQFDQAAGTLKKLRSQSWPERFRDLPSQINELENQLRKK
jgi:tetratricopeptide (TPR) repeat protein